MGILIGSKCKVDWLTGKQYVGFVMSHWVVLARHLVKGRVWLATGLRSVKRVCVIEGRNVIRLAETEWYSPQRQLAYFACKCFRFISPALSTRTVAEGRKRSFFVGGDGATRKSYACYSRSSVLVAAG